MTQPGSVDKRVQSQGWTESFGDIHCLHSGNRDVCGRHMTNSFARALQSFTNSIGATAPLTPPAIGMVAGIVLDREWQPASIWCWALLLVSLVMLFIGTVRRLCGPFVLLVLAGTAGALLHAQRVTAPRPNSIERVATETGLLLRLRGAILSRPQVLPGPSHLFARWSYARPRTAFVLDAEAVESRNSWTPVHGRVRVTFHEVLVNVAEGDRVEIFGRLTSLQPPSNPGGFDWAAFYRSQGIVARMTADHRECLIHRNDGPRRWIAPVRAWMKHRLRGWLLSDLSPAADDEGGLLEAMILGQQSQVDRRLNEVFIRSGCVHFLAASGTNVVIVLFLVNAPLRMLGVSRKRRALIMIAAAVTYALVTDARPPILRATVIGIVYCVSLLANRSRSHLNWISLTAILLAVIDPAMVFDVGYQLSSAAVIGVTFLAPALGNIAHDITRRARSAILGPSAMDTADLLTSVSQSTEGRIPMRLRVGRALRAIRRTLADALSVAFGAWLMAVPITAAVFNQVQPWGALNTVVIFPLMTLVMGLGFAKLVATPLIPTLGSVLANALSVLDRLIIGCVRRMADLPGADLTTTSPPWWVVTAYYLTLVFLMIWFRSKPKSFSSRDAGTASPGNERIAAGHTSYLQASRLAYLPVVGAVVILIGTVAVWCRPRGASDSLTVTVLSVGNGSATVIKGPDGRVWMYDAGSSGSFDVGSNLVLPFLSHRGINTVDRLYISHPNLDHYSGIPSIITGIRCGPVILNPHFERLSGASSPGRFLLEWLDGRGVRRRYVQAGDHDTEGGEVKIEVLWPPEGVSALKVNDTSTVLKITYRGYRLLLTGDIEEAAQEHLIERGGLRAEVLLLPHHGSVRRNTRRFIEAVGPRVAIRSSGERMEENTAGLAESVVDVLTFNTADHGAVEIRIDAQGLSVGPALTPSKNWYKVVN